MPTAFSSRTLVDFEAASASIPLRQLDRAFASADIRLGTDPGGPEGARRVQFRRYLATIDQADPMQLERLGHALGTLIGEVADSKVDYLVNAAARDGFFFAGGVFRPAESASRVFSLNRVEDLTSIDERGRQLHMLAADRPGDAIDGARDLVASVCRIVSAALGGKAAKESARLDEIVDEAIGVLELATTEPSEPVDTRTIVRRALHELGKMIADLERRDEARRSASLARLAIGAAVTCSGFVAEAYRGRASEPPMPTKDAGSTPIAAKRVRKVVTPDSGSKKR